MKNIQSDAKVNSMKTFPIFVTRGSKSSVRPHRHMHYEFAYILEGQVDNVVNGEHNILEKGDYFLLSPYEVHEYVPFGNEGYSLINICFTPEFIDSAFDLETPFADIVRHHSIGISLKGQDFPFGKTFICDDGSMHGLVTMALSEYRKAEKGKSNILKYSVLIILIKCLRNIAPADLDNKNKNFITEIIKYVDENVASDIVLAKICKDMGYNAQYVSRSFKEQMGINFTSYLHNVRMQKACSLLLSTDLSVAQVSYSVGYQNTAYFYRTFKKIVGVTPYKFRNKQ